MVKWGVRTMTLRAGCRALVCWVSLMGWGGLALAGAAHVHGQAVLEVALDGGELLLSLRGPQANHVGFDHAPRQAAHRQALAAMERHVAEASQWFLANPEARCMVASSEHAIEREPGGRHADVRVTVHFQCKAPEQLTHLVVMPWAAMPHLQRVQAVVVAPGGARKLTLARPSAQAQVVLDVRGAR